MAEAQRVALPDVSAATSPRPGLQAPVGGELGDLAVAQIEECPAAIDREDGSAISRGVSSSLRAEEIAHMAVRARLPDPLCDTAREDLFALEGAVLVEHEVMRVLAADPHRESSARRDFPDAIANVVGKIKIAGAVHHGRCDPIGADRGWEDRQRGQKDENSGKIPFHE